VPGRLLQKFIAAFACASACTAALAAVPTKFSAGAGEVRDFVAATALIGYAGTNGGGGWKTTDAGATWTRMNNLAGKTVWKIAVNPASSGNRLYAATEQGIFGSADAGANWTQLTQDAARTIAIQPGAAAAGPETLLAGVPGAGIYRSTDSGANWVRSSAGLDSTAAIGLAYYPGSTTTVYAILQCNVEDAPAPLSGNWGGVFRSTDGGVNWALFSTGLPAVDSTRPCANAIAANGTVVVVGIKDVSSLQGCVYRLTSAAAASWTASASSGACSPNGVPYGVEWIGPDFTNPSGFFLGSVQFGPWRSTDGGNTFGQAFTPGGLDTDFTATSFASGAFSATTWMASIYGIGLFRSTTSGSNGSWSLPATPIRADRVNDLSSHYGVAAGTYWMALKNGGVMKSTDSGANWAQFNSGLTNIGVISDAAVIEAHPNNVNVVGVGLRAYGLYQLSGSTWSSVMQLTGDDKPQGITITPGGRHYYTLFDFGQGLYAGNSFGALGSQNVPHINDANPAAGVISGGGRVRIMIDPNHQYLLVWDGLPYRTANNGASWTRVSVLPAAAQDTGFQRLSFFDITNKPADASLLVASSTRGIYRSNDYGGSWYRVPSTGLVQTALSSVVYTSNNVLWGGDRGGQLWCSANDGDSWQAVTGGNLGASITQLKVMNGLVHALTDGAGIWKKDTVCP
jgi:photosystem II stability/assembly factor-like uncharacterized protein